MVGLLTGVKLLCGFGRRRDNTAAARGEVDRFLLYLQVAVGDEETLACGLRFLFETWSVEARV